MNDPAAPKSVTHLTDLRVRAFDRAGTGLAVLDSEGVIVSLNAACAAVVGYAPEELEGRPFTAIVAERMRASALKVYKAALASGTNEPGLWTVCARDGRALDVLFKVQPLDGLRGGERHGVASMVDVTDVQAVEALAAVTEEQQAVLDNAFVGIAFTRDRHIERCNGRFAEMFGYTPAELAGRPTSILYPDEQSVALMSGLAGPPLSRGEPFQVEFELRRSDGTLRWCRIAAKAVRRDRPSRGTVWICEDITDERVSANALRRTLRDLELILENASVGIVFARDAGLVERCNRRFEEIMGYGPGDLDGRRTCDFFESGAAYEAFVVACQPLLTAGVPFEMEVRQRRGDGTMIWVRLSGRAADVADPQAGRIWIVQDVTAQRDAQAALARTRAELEQRVRERTSDIQLKNRALEDEIAERRAAEEALREKTERLNLQTTRLLALAQADKSNFDKALNDILGTAIATLGIDFASYWRMSEDGRRLSCERQYFAERGPVFSSAGTLLLEASAHPAYFEALERRHVIAADEARTHPATASLTPAYLEPLGISSCLVLPVCLDGRVVGVVSLDSRRECRRWAAEDVDFASGTAVIAALAIEAGQRRRAEKRLQHLAHHDSLTGLPNRNLLDDRLRQALAFASRQGSHVAVMLLDLDRFKTINDSLGHLVGDRMLTQVATRLAAALRAGDTIARLGGDEFLVVLPGVKGPADAATVAGHLMQRLAPGLVIDGRELHVSASIGISLYPSDGETVEALMRSADTAMYHAKDAGGNGFQFYAATMKVAATLRLDVETELRAALKRGELELYYQPVYSVATLELTGLEALLRWRHPRGEMLMPNDFVPVAEETGLIHEIGRWTLATACAQVRRWQADGFAVVPVSVNLSARQFRERDFADSVRNVLDRNSLDPRLLDIEVTEGTLMQHSPETQTALRALAELGVKISIDDFGVGYSNLVYLKRFAIDRIKIDQSFVRDIPAGSDDAVIAAAIISMARTLKLHVVAEGVENGAQLAFLAAHGCDEVQGMFLCPPLPAAATDRIFGPARR